jgi:hypothetical protein
VREHLLNALSGRRHHVDGFVMAQVAHRPSSVRACAQRDRSCSVRDRHAVEVVLVALTVTQSPITALLVEVLDDPQDHR